MLLRLAHHFGISEEEAQQMSGNQFTLVSRLAWCDVHFTKAGFVNKKQNPNDSMKDEFRITSLGVRELKFHSNELTVGYLQSFYRGKVYQGAGSDDATSEAELELYERFENMPDDFVVFHSVKWFAKGKGTCREADLLIHHGLHGGRRSEVQEGESPLER